MTDKLVRAVTTNGSFRAIATDTTDMMHEVSKYHDATTLGTTVLGRALAGGLLLANALLKDEERLVMTIDGGGPVGKIVVETSAEGAVRGYVQNPAVDLPKLDNGAEDVAGAVGTNGFLTVTKDMGEDMAPFTGQVQLVDGLIGDDITYYMAKSEQIPSSVAVTVNVDPETKEVTSAGGFIVSALPDTTGDELDQLEANLREFPSIGGVLEQNHEPMDLLNTLFGADNLKQLDDTPVSAYPENTKEDYAKMLSTLPAKELKAMLDEDKQVEVVDRFTGKKISFSEDELRAIYVKAAEKERAEAEDDNSAN